MRQWLVTLSAIALTAGVAVGDPATPVRTVDLRDAAAVERLRRSDPAGFVAIRQILASLQEHPERVESDWLQTIFDAHDVELSRLLLKTSYPPRQLLRFTLDRTRYTLHVTRSDLVARPALTIFGSDASDHALGI